jgi:hypothetical protein
MGLCCEVHDGIRFPDERVYKLAISNVASNESVAFLATQVFDVAEIPCVRKLVQIGNGRVRAAE